MAVAVNKVAQQFLNVRAGVAIPVAMQVFKASDIRVIYGITSQIAVQNVDYTISLANDFNTFTIVPTASLIAKINALIAADPSEQNYITVRRELDLLTESTSALARYTPFTSREHDRSAMRDQQLSDRLNRSLQLGERFVTDSPLLTLAELEPNRVLIVDPTGTQLIAGPNADEIENAQAYAAAAAAAAADAEAAAAAAATSQQFTNVDELLGWGLPLTVGKYVSTQVEGYTYRVEATGSANYHVVTAFGNRLRVIPKDGVWPAGAFGAKAVAGTDQRAAIQAAMDAAGVLGGVVQLGAGVYDIGFSGVLVGGRRRGLLPVSNVTLRGVGVGHTRLRVLAGANIDLMSSNRFPSGGEVTITAFHVQDMTLDGNAANQNPAAVEGFNIRLWSFRNCGLRNVRSENPNTWGVRLEYGDGLFIHNVSADHGPQSNSDGIHLVDCDNVVGGNCDVFTRGDDGFIIEVANKTMIGGYALSGISIRTPNELQLHARGLLLMADPNVQGAGARGMRNISIQGVTVRDCSGAGVILTGGIFENISIKGVVRNCGFGLAMSPGSASFAGHIRNCSFDLDIYACRDKFNNNSGQGTGASIFCGDGNGTFTSNYIRANVFDPAPGMAAVNLKGSIWSGEIHVTYPGSTNRPTNGVVLYAGNSDLTVSSRGCACGLNLQESANNNSLRLGIIDGAGDDALKILAGAVGNTFTGGRLVGTISNAGNAKFRGVVGADNSGAVNQSTDAAGDIVVNHGLIATPVTVMTQVYGQSSIVHARIHSRTSTDFTIRCLDVAGNPVTNTGASIAWSATL